MADTPPLDLYPLVRSLKSLLYGVADETLAIATPCPEWSVGDLIDHLTSSTWAFTRAARKSTAPQEAAASKSTAPQDAAAHRDDPQQADTAEPPPPPSAGNLHPQWRSRLPLWLDELADSWADPVAWTGTARLGGATLPAERMGLLAATELTVHGWDLARATGQNFAVDPRFLEILVGFLATPSEGTDSASPDGPSSDGDRPSLLIPEQRTAQRHRPEDFDGSSPWLRVTAIEDADPLLDRVVTLSGRDPAWQPRSRVSTNAAEAGSRRAIVS